MNIYPQKQSKTMKDWQNITLSERVKEATKSCLELRVDNISLWARKLIDELEKEIETLKKTKL